jgi:hypothetical protein
MNDKDVAIKYALMTIDQLIETGLTEYMYQQVMSTPSHPVNHARELLIEALQPKEG